MADNESPDTSAPTQDDPQPSPLDALDNLPAPAHDLVEKGGNIDDIEYR